MAESELQKKPESLITVTDETEYPLTAGPADFPLGITLIACGGGSTYPADYGVVVNIHSTPVERSIQLSFGYNGGSKWRLANSANSWLAWRST